MKGHKGLAEMLVDRGAELNLQNDRGQTVLHKLCDLGKMQGIEHLFMLGNIEDDVQDKQGNTPLHLACARGSADIVTFLLEKGTNLTLTNNEGQTPLHLACKRGDVGIVEQLLSASNMDINQRDNKGNTLLHIASEKGHTELVRFLLRKGADYMAENTHGQTPLRVSNSTDVENVYQDWANTLNCFYSMPASAKEHEKEGFSQLRDKVLASMANVPENKREHEATKLLEKLYKHIPSADDGKFTRLAHGKKPHPLEIVDGKVRFKENWEALVEERVNPSRYL